MCGVAWPRASVILARNVLGLASLWFAVHDARPERA
jgi:hypothetical protein